MPEGLASISIVIPAYNEAKRLPATIDSILAYLSAQPRSFAEILVVDDGSIDDTAAMVERIAAEQSDDRIRLMKNPGNRGKGYSVRHGMLESKGDWILSTDADLSAPIGELDKLFAAALREGAEVAIGSRALDRSLVGVHQSAFRELSGRLFNVAMRVLTGLPFRDTQCGFKLFRADAARAIFSRQTLDGFSFDVEDLVIAAVLRRHVVEVPVVWNNVEGTKVSGFAGIASFGALLGIKWRALTGRYR